MLWLVSRLVVMLIAIGLAAGWVWRGGSRAHRRRAQEQQASQAFRAQRNQLLGRLAKVLGAEANPIAPLQGVGPVLARDASTGDLLALVAFRPAVDSNDTVMSAVFVWRRGQWETEGRLLVGETPAECCASRPRELFVLAWPDE